VNDETRLPGVADLLTPILVQYGNDVQRTTFSARIDAMKTAVDACVAAIEARDAALAARLHIAQELLALYHPQHEYPTTHVCPGCAFLGRALAEPGTIPTGTAEDKS
jgi:Xaa-Pro aminopeptidase